MKNSFIFISNSFGGIKTFQNTLIEFLIDYKLDCFLIDRENYKKKNKKIKFFKLNVLDEIFKTFKILKKISKRNKNKKSIFILSNPVILVTYFIYIKLFFKESKIFFFSHSHLTKKRFILLIFNFISSFIFLFLNKVFYVSKFTKRWWEKNFYFCKYAKNSIQYNSIHIQKKKVRKIKKKFSIGFVGRLTKEKGIENFLKIANYNKQNFLFNIFSDEKLKLTNPQKKYINFFFNFKTKDIYKKIDLLLVTSPLENCPFSVLEAKSYGIPILAYLTKGGIKEIVRNNKDGILLDKKSNQLLIQKYLYKIKKNYDFFSKNAFLNAEKFNSKINIKKLINNELLN